MTNDIRNRQRESTSGRQPLPQTPDPETPTDAAALRSVLDRTATLIDAVPAGSYGDATPCADWTVERLLAHIVGWTEAFANRAEGMDPSSDPDATPVDGDSGARFRTAAVRINAAEATDGPRPGRAADRGMLIAEYICHGTDLARATGMRAGYDEAAAAIGLAALRGMLTPEYRTHGFGPEVPVDAGAGAVAALLAFSGRAPEVGSAEPQV